MTQEDGKWLKEKKLKRIKIKDKRKATTKLKIPLILKNFSGPRKEKDFCK